PGPSGDAHFPRRRSMNPARPRPGAIVAKLSDIPDPGAIVRHFAEGDARFSILLTRTGARVCAFENRCAHADYPLERPDGRVVVQEGRFVVCTAHGASFTFEGECAGGPCNGDALTPIAVEVTESAVKMA